MAGHGARVSGSTVGAEDLLVNEDPVQGLAFLLSVNNVSVGPPDRLRNPFSPVTRETYGASALLSLTLILFLVGMAANLTLICIVCNNRYLQNVSNSLLASMAFWDFVIIFVCLPLTAIHELTGTWLMGDFTCKLVPYLEVCSLGITTFTIAALCLDRFHAATNVRLHYEQMEGCGSRGGKLAVVWLGALLLSLPELLVHRLSGWGPGGAVTGLVQRCLVEASRDLPEPAFLLAATYQVARPWWCFGCYFCLPIVFTVICSTLTAQRMKHSGIPAVGKAEEGQVKRGTACRQMRLERQLNCAVVALATAYGCCVVPENVCNIVATYAGPNSSPTTLAVLHAVAQYLLFCKSCVSPALLFGMCRQFSRAVAVCCCCCCADCDHLGVSSSSTASSLTSSPRSPVVVPITAASDENRNERAPRNVEMLTFSTVQQQMASYSKA
uniref:prosaposin receptor GPR37-like n=1 Tax=Myxine glutinosa TaxID=7769 RepID=UPI00358F6087